MTDTADFRRSALASHVTQHGGPMAIFGHAASPQVVAQFVDLGFDGGGEHGLFPFNLWGQGAHPSRGIHGGYTGLCLCDALCVIQPEAIHTVIASGIAAILSPHNVRDAVGSIGSLDFCEPWPLDLTFKTEMGRDRTGRVVDPDNKGMRMLQNNKVACTRMRRYILRCH